MQFLINGKSYEIDKKTVINSLKGTTPANFDGRHKYYIEINGEKYPIKQILHLVTGLPNIEFHASDAKSVLRKLGFDIHTIGYEVRETREKYHARDSLKFAVVLGKDEDGYIVASCPILPGCHSQGRTKQEAVKNISEAIRGYIASMRMHGEPLPVDAEIQEVEVAV